VRGVWVVLALGGLALAPVGAWGADHRDAPGAKANAFLDINDVYIFQSTTPDHSVIIVTVVPLAGIFNLPVFSSAGVYDVNVDNNGDALEDLTFRFAFSNPNRQGQQKVAVQLIKNHATKLIAQDLTGKTIAAAQGVTIMASLFSDPFFFDLNAFNAFKASHFTMPGVFCNPGSDFFVGLNTLAIVMDVPNTLLRASSTQHMIGVWARTLDATGKQVDRMGRPAINTVLIPDAMKDLFNMGIPSHDQANFGATVTATLTALMANTALTNVLLPDILTFDTSSSAGFLNGRKLTDDVIDAELMLLTKNVGVTTDCVGQHSDYLTHFPYLGTPHPIFISH
jgi:hypothetical protein